MSGILETALTLGVIGALVVASITDLSARRIPNRLSILIMLAGFCLMAIRLQAGGDAATTILWPVVAATTVFLSGLCMFAAGVMGGGDVKLMAAIALALVPGAVLPFLFITAIVGGIVAGATAVWAVMQQRWVFLDDLENGFTGSTAALTAKTVQVPYGVAIAAGGICVLIPALIVPGAA